ncbi:monoacylglycerol lipase-like [Leucoraja erinacea]|uniref:monoacylglycerol lipase-like n=1 Tax=Leucoraja erinaceus TaxID=7782 RepID=UPI002455689E|nr:monoacylglycerol lipase-like [Leucoraja erinacea]
MLLAKLLYHMLPRLPLGYIDPLAISSDNRQVSTYINDPLVYHGPVTVKFAFEVLNALNTIEKLFPTITSPVLIMHGDADTLSDIRGSYIMYGKLGSMDKTFKTFVNASHELHYEPLPVRSKVLKLIRTWLQDRLPAAT